jgi:hypothetical protein
VPACQRAPVVGEVHSLLKYYHYRYHEGPR